MNNKTKLVATLGALFTTGLLVTGFANAEFKPEPQSLSGKVAPTEKTEKTALTPSSSSTNNAAVSAKSKEEMIAALKAKLKAVFHSEPDTITESPIPNVFQVMYGTEVVYISADGKYFIAGDLINLETRENLTEVSKYSLRKTAMNKQDNKPVTFKAKNEKHVIQVFTDIDCPYCSKLHREVPELNEKGITVEYLMFPRAGVGSPSFKKAISMWCSDDNKKAMTEAKERRPIEEKTCENPILAQYKLGQEVGVTGTPALVLDSGKLIPGYIPAAKLVQMLDAEKGEAKK